MKYIEFECKEDGKSPLTKEQTEWALANAEMYVKTMGMTIQITAQEFSEYMCGVVYKVGLATTS